MSPSSSDYKAWLLYERNSLGWSDARTWEELSEYSRDIYRAHVKERENRNTSTSGSSTK